jgi:polar amino acid transport system substrate-binding protein
MPRNFLIRMSLAVVCLMATTVPSARAQFFQSPYFEKVRSGEPLVIALNKDTPPFCLLDSEGNPHGLDVELSRLLGEALGAEITFVYPLFKDIVAGVENESWDLAIANLTITIARAQKVSFSHSYMDITQGVLLDRRFIPRTIVEGVVKDVTVDSFDDLRNIPGLVLGTWDHTTSSELLKTQHSEKKYRLYPDVLAARQALQEGEINALVADSPTIEFISNFYSDDRKRFKALTKPDTLERLAIAVHLGDPTFVEFLNQFIDELKANGTLAELEREFTENTSWAKEVLK